MSYLISLVVLLFSVPVMAAQTEEFGVRTFDKTAVLNGQIDLPLKEKCGQAPYPSVLIVSGSGLVDRDGYFGRTGTDADYIYKDLSSQLTERCLAVARWDYRGVSCAPKSKDEISKCFDEPIRAQMTHQKILEDIQAIYEFIASNKNIQKDNLVVVGHSEGSLNVSSLIDLKKINPKAVLFMGAMAGSPISVFRWQSVERYVEWLFELDQSGDKKVTKDEIDANFSGSKISMLGPKEQWYPTEEYWTEESLRNLLAGAYENYKSEILALDDEEPFKLNGVTIAKASYWKMWFSDTRSVVDRLQSYQGRVLYISGDIDSQTPGAKQLKYIEDNWSSANRPDGILLRGIGHCFGTHPLLGPMDITARSILVDELVRLSKFQ